MMNNRLGPIGTMFLGCLLLVLSTGACTSPPYHPQRAAMVGTEVPPDVEYWRGDFLGAGGLKLYEQGWRPVQPPRAVIVLVHGLKDHSSRYREFATMLALRGIAVYAIDLRGHGYSEGTRGHLDSLENCADDLNILIGRVRDRHTGKPIFLFGQGMGGSLAAIEALWKKPMPAGLILSAPMLRFPAKSSERIGTRMTAMLGPTTQQLKLNVEDWSSDPRVVAVLKNDPLIFRGDSTAMTAEELLRASDVIEKRAGELKLPVLVLQGTADKVSDPALTQHLFERIGSADKTFKTYDGLWHDLLHEPKRDDVSNDLMAWVNAESVKAVPPPAAPEKKGKAAVRRSKAAADAPTFR